MTDMTGKQTEVALTVALIGLAGILGDGMTASMVGGHFTCMEAEAICEVLEFSGHHDAAVTFLIGHAQGDDDSDDVHAWGYGNVKDEDVTAEAEACVAAMRAAAVAPVTADEVTA